MQPGAEVGTRFERGKTAVRPDEAFLHHVLRVALVPHQPEGQAEGCARMELDEHTERVLVALAGARQDDCCLAGVHSNNLDGWPDGVVRAIWTAWQRLPRGFPRPRPG